MFTRLRTTWLASSSALLLILAVSGVALGATVLTAVTPESDPDPGVVDTTLTWEDVDGDGIDDDCDDEVAENAEAAAAELASVDTDGDGTISVTEAAHSDRIGGTNCNHGGYVSQVAHDDGDQECEAPTEASEPTDTPVVEVAAEFDEDEIAEEEAAPVVCEPEDEAEAEEVAEEAADEACEATEIPPFDPATATGPGAFGAYVSSIAQSDAVGGKNCNHGGAVSDAVKAAKEAAREAREAAKAERAAAREAAKAERAAERAAAKAERAAAKAAKSHGKGKHQGGD